MSLVCDQRPSKGRPEVVLRATRGDYNNIPYNATVAAAIIIKIIIILYFFNSPKKQIILGF